MPYDEDTKVFDVARPSKAYPDATSKPVIVGHRPQMSDPMVKEDTPIPSSPGTPIHVSLADEEPADALAHPAEAGAPSIEPESAGAFEQHYTAAENFAHDNSAEMPKHDDQPESEEHMLSMPAEAEHSEEPAGGFTPLHTLLPEESVDPNNHQQSANYEESQPNHDHDGGGWHDAPPLPITPGAGPKRRWPKVLGLLFLLALIAVIAGYLAIDAGLVKSNIKLPFHIFNKQKTSTSAAPPPSPAPVANNNPAPTPESSAPNGFTAYKLAGTNISFAYPTAWGAPAVTNDPGFSKRGGTNKSDGIYAYLVNFATNKDVQLAFTSSKYLPTVRTALYYDFLQWCTGTNDGKIYKQILHFTTANKIDTPGTIACDQGPLADATKIDNLSIVQLNTKDPSGKPIGDLYTEDLTGTDIVVLHAKDTAMKSGDDIKNLLTSVKTSPSSGSSPITTP